ncbi:GtrA family protein [Dictyobacter formicarum]|uniref:GtrA/DPMS transmembrane domain-containing protein n=1 Tax=Dictyobacter formicarum TaxID=2778368 RepID=A0ABQ3VM76_9CHLR|nr:GtrA family protein [Dictyobacter formicarum]GHO86708.1 hypothetical protein KSZ_47140 [Dictyobacter formicarum]
MDRFVQNSVEEIVDPSREVMEELVEIVDQVAPVQVVPSYRPTRWDVVNSLLDRLDIMTGGRAGSLVQFFTFLFIGGTTTIVNLVILYVVLNYISLPNAFFHNLLGSTLGSELSLLANFALNDRFTFRFMPGHERSWYVRLSRFHATAIGGILLTILIQTLLINLLHINALIGQAIAVVIVLFYNFFFHQFFTYRRLKNVEEAI